MLLLGGVELLTPNVALNGEATQSSTHHHTKPKTAFSFDDPDDAHYAIDGNFGTDMTNLGEKCAHTNEDPGAWWQVDGSMKYEFEITKVAVTTRKYGKSRYFGIPDIPLGVTLVVKVFHRS